MKAPDWRYGPAAIILHWLLALLLTGMAALGWYMMSIEHTPDGDWCLALHKSIGMTVAALVLIRVLNRIANPAQDLPASVPAWQIKLAAGTQRLLYLLMVAMPLSGYLGASYSKTGVQVFGMATPAWTVPNHDRAEQFFDIHSTLVWVLVALIGLHVLGALRHMLIDKDGLAQRMWFKPRA